jgi:hypothetical protein
MAVVGGAAQRLGRGGRRRRITMPQAMAAGLLPKLFGQTATSRVIVFGILLILVLQRARDGLWPMAGAAGAGAGREPRTVDRAASPAAARPAGPATVLLEVKDARKQFGGLVANNNMNLFREGRRDPGLIGPNGAGKSTMFNCISGVDPPPPARSASWASASSSSARARSPGGHGPHLPARAPAAAP